MVEAEVGSFAERVTNRNISIAPRMRDHEERMLVR